MKNIFSINLFSACLLAGSICSCDGYLDKMPDNRTEIDSEDKVTSLLTSAYPISDYIMLTEMMSDNADDYGVKYKSSDRFIDQVWAWEDVTEADNESPENIWQGHYDAIAAANQALESIEEMGGATTTVLKEAKAEALLCRAYNYFMLVNIFCRNYNKSTSDKDLGIPYLTKPETVLNPKYDRGTVAEVYDLIDKDLQEALPNVGDSYYTVPKYHFNQKAAYAFAARFYLFYEKWDEAVKYADKCLGSNPAQMLRDWKYLGTVPSSEYEICVNEYISATSNANLLLVTAYSAVGLAFGPYSYYTKYSHGAYLASTETCFAQQPLGSGKKVLEPLYRYFPRTYENALDRVCFWKLPYLFEVSNPVAQTGFYRTVYPAVWSDECLLNRAEALVMLGRYDDAAADLTAWMRNVYNTSASLTPESIASLYSSMAYYEWDKPTPKKHLHPAFSIGAEGGVCESMLQCVLHFKRIETLGQGLRWFDVKRYGIEICRRSMNAEGAVDKCLDVLTTDDDRRAVQLPLKVRDAGLEPNPRSAK